MHIRVSRHTHATLIFSSSPLSFNWSSHIRTILFCLRFHVSGDECFEGYEVPSENPHARSDDKKSETCVLFVRDKARSRVKKKKINKKQEKQNDIF